MPVVVNRRLITDADINRETAHVESGSISQRHEQAAQRLVVRELLQQKAEQLGIDTGQDMDAAIERLLERELRIPEPDSSACRRYFDANPERFRTPVTAEVRHILLKAAPDDPEERMQAERQAGDIITALQAARSSFEALAERHSACASAGNGGRLGTIGRGQTVPEFEDVVLRLAIGLAARPVETRYGFHVVEVLGREGGQPLPYAAVSARIAGYLHERSWRLAVQQYLQSLLDEAEISATGLPPAAPSALQ